MSIEIIDSLISINSFLNTILFYKLFGVPFVVLWLIIAILFFTFGLNFVNIRFISKSLSILKQQTNYKNNEISPLSALFTAISGQVGVGSIAGTAAAISLGGPGAIFWMIFASFFIMSLKFAEVTIGHMYRTEDDDGNILGGPFIYLKNGLKDIGYGNFGLILSVIFSLIYLVVPIGPGCIVQAQQATSLLIDTFSFIDDSHKIYIASFLIFMILLVSYEGIHSLARASMSIVPVMATMYLFSCVVVLLYNITSLPNALYMIIYDAFHAEKVVSGGLIGLIVLGIQRAAFASEAGVGSSSIEHATSGVRKPAEEGLIAMLEPLISIVLICGITGLTIVITNVHTANIEPELLIKAAFYTIHPALGIMLTITILLFAFSTIITNAYHGDRAWVSLFGTKLSWIYKLFFLTSVFVGCYAKNFLSILDICDYIFLIATIPNITALYFLFPKIKSEIKKHLYH